MGETTVTRMRLTEGVWEGLVDSHGPTPPELRLRHNDDLVGTPETLAAGTPGHWLVRFRLPVERLSDGVQTFVIEDARNGEALAHETVVTGDAAEDDLRAEVSLLRAELDLLKRAFRRHCSES